MRKERLECFPARLSPGDRSRSARGISLSVTQGWTRLDRLRDFQPDGVGEDASQVDGNICRRPIFRGECMSQSGEPAAAIHDPRRHVQPGQHVARLQGI